MPPNAFHGYGTKVSRSGSLGVEELGRSLDEDFRVGVVWAALFVAVAGFSGERRRGGFTIYTARLGD